MSPPQSTINDILPFTDDILPFTDDSLIEGEDDLSIMSASFSSSLIQGTVEEEKEETSSPPPLQQTTSNNPPKSQKIVIDKKQASERFLILDDDDIVNRTIDDNEEEVADKMDMSEPPQLNLNADLQKLLDEANARADNAESRLSSSEKEVDILKSDLLNLNEAKTKAQDVETRLTSSEKEVDKLKNDLLDRDNAAGESSKNQMRFVEVEAKAQAAESRASSFEKEVIALRKDLLNLTKLETSERSKLMEVELKVHDLQVEHATSSKPITTALTDETVSTSITALVGEYLVFCDFRNTVDCLNSEARCVRFKPTFDYDSKQTGVARAEHAKMTLLRSFDEGDSANFYSIWTATVPPNFMSESKDNKIMALKLQIHFATYSLKKRIIFDEKSAYPCSQDESSGLIKLKQALQDASDDVEMMNDTDVFAYLTLSSLTHPHLHPSLSSEDANIETSVFSLDIKDGDDRGENEEPKTSLNNRWTTTLRSDLALFCSNRLPLINPPRLVTLFQAFNKWETSLDSHVTKSTKVTKDMAELSNELLGINVKLLNDMENSRGSEFTAMYYQNMKRYIITSKNRLASLVSSILPSENVSLPPISFTSLNDYLSTHSGELDVVGNVLRALIKRINTSSDVKIKEHASHDACVGDILSYFNKNNSTSVIINLLTSKTTKEQTSSVTSSRATYTASLLLATMSKFKTSRIYLLTSNSGNSLLTALTECLENSLNGDTCLEAGVNCLIALQRLTVERNGALACVEFGVFERVSKVLSCLMINDVVPRRVFFLAKIIIDEKVKRNPAAASREWNELKAWNNLTSSFYDYGSALLLNVVGGFHGPSFEKSYLKSFEDRDTDNTLKHILKAALNLNTESKTNGKSKSQQGNLLSAGNALLYSSAARRFCVYNGGEKLDVAMLGGEKAFMMIHLVSQLQLQLNVNDESFGEMDIEEDKDEGNEVDVLEDKVVFEWDYDVDLEEKDGEKNENVLDAFLLSKKIWK